MESCLTNLYVWFSVLLYEEILLSSAGLQFPEFNKTDKINEKLLDKIV